MEIIKRGRLQVSDTFPSMTAKHFKESFHALIFRLAISVFFIIIIILQLQLKVFWLFSWPVVTGMVGFSPAIFLLNTVSCCRMLSYTSLPLSTSIRHKPGGWKLKLSWRIGKMVIPYSHGMGGAVASWLVHSTPDRVARVRALGGVTVMCS